MIEPHILEMLKVDLGLTKEAYDNRLLNCIETAKENIISEGVSDLNMGDFSDVNLVIMYAAWMWRKRDNGDGMPRMLRWALNNRVMGAKAK